MVDAGQSAALTRSIASCSCAIGCSHLVTWVLDLGRARRTVIASSQGPDPPWHSVGPHRLTAVDACINVTRMSLRARFLTISVAAGMALGLAASVGGAVDAQTLSSVWDGVYTAAQAERGSAFYVKECASCHGEGLAGQDQSPGLIGPDFLATWDGQAVGDLFEQTRKSMPKDNANTFSRQEYLDVVAFMLRANGFPAGKIELPRATADLTQLRIDQFRPAAP